MQLLLLGIQVFAAQKADGCSHALSTLVLAAHLTSLPAVLLLCLGAACNLLSHGPCPPLLAQQPVLLPREGHFPKVEASFFFHKILSKLFCIYSVR